jgi:hypothetical protein
MKRRLSRESVRKVRRDASTRRQSFVGSEKIFYANTGRWTRSTQIGPRKDASAWPPQRPPSPKGGGEYRLPARPVLTSMRDCAATQRDLQRPRPIGKAITPKIHAQLAANQSARPANAINPGAINLGRRCCGRPVPARRLHWAEPAPRPRRSLTPSRHSIWPRSWAIAPRQCPQYI